MLFKKIDGEPEKIRVNDPNFWTGWKWVTIRKGTTVDLSEDQGFRLKLTPVKSKSDDSKGIIVDSPKTTEEESKPNGTLPFKFGPIC